MTKRLSMPIDSTPTAGIGIRGNMMAANVQVDRLPVAPPHSTPP